MSKKGCCRYRDCVTKLRGDNPSQLCSVHYRLLFERFSKRLSENDTRFLLGSPGRPAGDVAKYLEIGDEIIDHFFTRESEDLVYGGPMAFLPRQKILLVLINQNKLRKIEASLLETRRKLKEQRRKERKVQEAQQAVAVSKPAPKLPEPPSPPTNKVPEKAEPSSPPAPPAKRSRRGIRRIEREADEFLLDEVATLLDISATPVKKWVESGALHYRTVPFSGNRTAKLFKLVDIVSFVRGCYGNHKFVRYGRRFDAFLAKHDPDWPGAKAPSEASPPPEPEPPPLPEIVKYLVNKPHRYGRAEDELTAWDIVYLTYRLTGRDGFSDTTVYGWMNTGRLPFVSRPYGRGGQAMKLVKWADYVAFAQNSLGDEQMVKYHDIFQELLTRLREENTT